MIPIVTAVAYLLRDLTATAGMILFMQMVFRREVCFSVPKAALLVGLMACNACVGSFVLMGQVEDYKAIMDFAAVACPAAETYLTAVWCALSVSPDFSSTIFSRIMTSKTASPRYASVEVLNLKASSLVM